MVNCWFKGAFCFFFLIVFSYHRVLLLCIIFCNDSKYYCWNVFWIDYGNVKKVFFGQTNICRWRIEKRPKIWNIKQWLRHTIIIYHKETCDNRYTQKKRYFNLAVVVLFARVWKNEKFPENSVHVYWLYSYRPKQNDCNNINNKLYLHFEPKFFFLVGCNNKQSWILSISIHSRQLSPVRSKQTSNPTMETTSICQLYNHGHSRCQK